MIRDGAGKDTAKDAGDAQQHAPVLVHKGLTLLERNRIRTVLLHHSLTQEARAELDRDQDPDHWLCEQPPHDDAQRIRMLLAAGRIACVKVLQTRVARRVTNDAQGQEEHRGQHGRRYPEWCHHTRPTEEQQRPVIREVQAE